jgi:hypothetical protein
VLREATTVHIRTWHVELFIHEDDDETTARAVLHGDSPHHPEGSGLARRAPSDRPVPEIGDEVAAARALHALADSLLRIASDDISAFDDRPVHVDLRGPSRVATGAHRSVPAPMRTEGSLTPGR